VVPRHPQRFDEVGDLARGCGMNVSRRSEWDSQPQAADVWLGDSLGEMAFYYGLSDVALLGGSFAAEISPIGTRSADGNTFINFTFVEDFQGTLTGTRAGTGWLVIHPDGTINARDSGLFAGSIGGASGTAILSASLSGTFSALAADFVVTDGTGGLSRIHVEGTAAGAATGPVTFAGTYSGQVSSSGS